MFLSSFEGLRQVIRNSSVIEALVHTGYHTFENVLVDCALFTIRHEPIENRRQASIGTYFRLIRERDAEAKRMTFERTVCEINHSETEIQSVFRYRQHDFDVIPGAPWVYWLTPTLRILFEHLSYLEQIAPSRQGMATADNFRFLQYWWEIGNRSIAHQCSSRDESAIRIEKWYPYMKGGAFKRWFGNQELCVNYGRNGYEIKAWANPLYGNSGWSRIIKSTDCYFRSGITWSDLTQGRFAARLSPGGFIFDVKGSSAFPSEDKIPLVLALLNSEFAHYALNLLNPTVSFQVGDLARLPIPTQTSETLNGLVERAIELARQDSIESETTYDFVAPPAWLTGSADVAARHAELAAVEREIDEEVYWLYGIEGEDRRAIEEELSVVRGPLSVEEHSESVVRGPLSVVDDEQLTTDNQQLTTDNGQLATDDGQPTTDDGQLTNDSLARQWLSYALGIALGRFQPGVEGAIGRGRFAPEVAAALRALADEDGLGLIEANHPDDLCARVERALALMVGEDQAHEVIAAATGGKPLAAYLTSDFYKEHTRQYRKRPVYWLLQSPRRSFSMLLFHERLTGDSLPLILGNRYLNGRINALRDRLGEAQSQIEQAAPGREKRQAERLREDVGQELADAEEFARLIRVVLERQNERGEVAGWRPAIDDGVLINLAPLHTLVPAWAAEPKKCWQALERGDYDWSHTAMRYWPDRVLEKCRTNKSYAIAHGVGI
jgi:hypothetical protein